MNKELKLNACAQPNDFIDSGLEFEDYALMHGTTIGKLRNGENDANSWDLLIKIQANGKTIYRKAKGYNKANGDVVMLGHRSRSILGVTNGEPKVTIKKACWFMYHWNQVNPTNRWSFRISIISTIITLLSLFK